MLYKSVIAFSCKDILSEFVFKTKFNNYIFFTQGDTQIFRQERISVQTIIPLPHSIVFNYETTSPITSASFEVDEVSIFLD